MPKHFKQILLAAFLVLGLSISGSAAGAQEQQPDAVTIDDLEELAAAIEDESERQELLKRLQALIELRKAESETPEEPTLGSIVIEQISAHGEALGRQLSSLAEAVLSIPDGVAGLANTLSDPGTLAVWTQAALALCGVILAGFLAQSLVRRLLARPLAAVAWRKDESLPMRLVLLVTRLVLILVPPLAFAATAALLLSLFGPDSVARPSTLAVIYAVAITGAVNAISRTLLAPGVAAVRPLRVSDETAHYLHFWVIRVTTVAVFGYFGVQIAGFLGLAGPAQAFLFKLVGLLLTLLCVMFILQNRRAVARMIAGHDGGKFLQFRRRVADLWHVLAVLYVVMAYTVWVTGMPGGFAYVSQATLLSALAIVLGILASSVAKRLIDRTFSLSEDLKRNLPGLEARVNRYLPFVKSILRGLIITVAFLAVLQAWGLDVLEWLSSPAGSAVVSRIAVIAAIILLAIVGWEALSAAIERYLSSEEAARSHRAQTLLPLIRKVTLAVLIVIVGLTVLSELGINIAPLLAGAGVVGLAVGFGAQTLVRDIITGLFILIEDTISVGDYVMLGGNDGTVEALSIRSIRLRDPSGTVHTIPFSDVTTVVNYSREFAFAVMEIGVAYKEDVDEVIRVIEEVGKELRMDEGQQANILDDLQVLGLDRFDDSAVVIKVRIKTAPGMQWAVRRAYNRLLKRRFDADGIEIPFPQRTVWFAEEPKDGDATGKEDDKVERRYPPQSSASVDGEAERGD